MTLKIKICCVSSIKEAEMALKYGADAIGLVGAMPSGPGIIDDELIAEIAGSIPKGIETFLLTSETNSEEIIAHHRKVNTTTIQIVDSLIHGSHAEIRRELPDVKLVQVIHVIDESTIDAALEAAETADVILLDSGSPGLSVKKLGGTGRTHNWDVSRRISEQSPKPVFLAGGLTPENVAKAIDFVRPHGVDLCSGVRTGNRLDPNKLEKFMDAVRNGEIQTR